MTQTDLSDSKARDVDQQPSARGLVWRYDELDPGRVHAYARETGIIEPLAALLIRRGVPQEEVQHFLSPTLRHYLPDPSSFQDMDKAVRLICDGMFAEKKIVVLADYDVDGATSAAQLIRYFRHFGFEIGLYVPDRLKEGYGPSVAAFDHLKAENTDLVITVDCGAAATAALNHANQIGLDVIVIDHHLMGDDIPACTALVNPNRPDCTSGQGHLAAAGVVYVLLVGINRYIREHMPEVSTPLPDLIQALDLCALGTLCDMAPLKGVNRAFVMQGLRIIAQDQSPGLLALSNVAGRSPPRRVNDLTFGIGPQLNAGGRIGDPWTATNLLAAETLNASVPLAEELFTLNEARKEVEADILNQARQKIQNMLDTRPDLPALLVGGKNWHPGVIGIVAGRLKDEFHRPVIVVGWGDDYGPLAKGSARSVSGINIGNVIAAAAREGVLVSGGGHAMAGGLSMMQEQFPGFERFLLDRLSNVERELTEARDIAVDLDIMGTALSLNLLDLLEKAGPFGAGAPKPVIRIKNARVDFRRTVGKGHLKVTLDDGTAKIDCIAWRAEDRPLGEILNVGRKIDVIGYVERNSWQGRESVQFEIIDGKCKN